MNAVRIRTAVHQDLATLLRFQEGVVNAERPFDRTLRAGSIQYYDIGRMLLAEEVRFVVAESADRLVGCGFARLAASKPYLRHPTHGYLGLMYVDPDYRGQSINGRIVSALKDWCLSKGTTELRLEVYSDNAQAIRAYEKAGFSRHIIEMRMGLSEE
jgi:GNAT superfamily N-acetyltransferase